MCHWIGDSNRTIRDLVQGDSDRRAANEKVIQTNKKRRIDVNYPRLFRGVVSTGVIYTNYLYYIGYAYTVYVAKQNPVKGFGETNIIRDHELTTADIVELQQSLGKNLIVNNHLQAVRPNIWSPPQPPQADVVLTSVTLLSTMRE